MKREDFFFVFFSFLFVLVFVVVVFLVLVFVFVSYFICFVLYRTKYNSTNLGVQIKDDISLFFTSSLSTVVYRVLYL